MDIDLQINWKANNHEPRMSYGFTLNNKQYNSWCYLNFQCHMQEGDYTPLTVPDCLYIIFWQFIGDARATEMCLKNIYI